MKTAVVGADNKGWPERARCPEPLALLRITERRIRRSASDCAFTLTECRDGEDG